jgi:hypothetical protein
METTQEVADSPEPLAIVSPSKDTTQEVADSPEPLAIVSPSKDPTSILPEAPKVSNSDEHLQQINETLEHPAELENPLNPKLEISTDIPDRPITDSPLVPLAPNTDVSESVRELVSKFSGLPYKDPNEIVYPDDDSSVENADRSRGGVEGDLVQGDVGKSRGSVAGERASVGKFGRSRDSVAISKSRESIAVPRSRDSIAIVKSRESIAVAKSRDSISKGGLDKSNSNIQPFGRSNAVNKSRVSMAEKMAKSRESIAERTSIVLQAEESTRLEDKVRSSRESDVEPTLPKSSYVSIAEKRKSTQSIVRSVEAPVKRKSVLEKIVSPRKKTVVPDSSSDEEVHKPIVKLAIKRATRAKNTPPEENIKKRALAKDAVQKGSTSKKSEQV